MWALIDRVVDEEDVALHLSSVEMLSARERECLRLVRQGLGTKEIALRLGGLSPRTVDGYIESAAAKLGVRKRTIAAEILANCEAGPGPVNLRGDPEGVGEMPLFPPIIGQPEPVFELRDQSASFSIGSEFERLASEALGQKRGARNELTTTERLGGIFKWMLIGLMAFGLAMIGFEGLHHASVGISRRFHITKI